MPRKQRPRKIWEQPTVKKRKTRTIRHKKKKQERPELSEHMSSMENQQSMSPDVEQMVEACVYSKWVPKSGKMQQQTGQGSPASGRCKEIYKELRAVLESKDQPQGEHPLSLDRDQIHGQLDSFADRGIEARAIVNFLKERDSAHSSVKVLYIYGTPGTGKTYLAHNILVGLDLIQSTTWVNCLTLQSSNKEFNLVRRILVLDEFDQASFIDFNAMTRLMHMNFCRIILIANEHRCSLSEEYIRRSFNAVVVQKLPFPPYSMSVAANILTRKMQPLNKKIQKELGLNNFALFSPIAVQFAVKCTFQQQSHDLRTVVAILLKAYEEKMVQDEQNLKQESVQIGIESIAVTIAAMSNPLVLYIRQLCRRGKEALQWILNHLDAQSRWDRTVKLDTRKFFLICNSLGLRSSDVRRWLQQWKEMGIISLKKLQPKSYQLCGYETAKLLVDLKPNWFY